MTDSGGGKSKSKRIHGISKPYERRQSFFGSLTDTVKSVVTPSWLTDLVRTVKRSPKSNESLTEEKHRVDKQKFSVNDSNLKSNTVEFGQLPKETMQPKTDPFKSITSGSLSLDNSYTPEDVTLYKKSESMNVFPSNLSQYKEEQTQVKELADVTEKIGINGETEHSVEPSSVKLNQAATWTAEYNSKMSRKPAVWRTPGFDVTLFGTADERSHNAGGGGSHMSPFYSGKTCFGGSLSQKSRMNRTAPNLKYLPCPVRQKMKPNTKNVPSTSSAKRILETLQKISTPLNDARKIPFGDLVRDSPTSVSVRARGPPRGQLSTPLAASVTKNRQSIKFQETQSANSQEELPKETKSKIVPDFTLSAGGKLKEKKFSQHISKRGNFYDEEVDLPNLRTEFTLPIENITGMKFGILDKENGTKEKDQRNGRDGVFTFSSPVEKGQILNTTTPVPKMNFTFSSPIKVHSPQTSFSQTSVNVGEGKSTADHICQPSSLKPYSDKTEVHQREVHTEAPVKTWDCDVCLVPNKMENAKCLACESPRSGSQPSTSGFMVKPKAFSSQTGFVVESDGPTSPEKKEFSLNIDGINKSAPIGKPTGSLENEFQNASSFKQNWQFDRKTKRKNEENNGSKEEETREGSFLKISGVTKENESPKKYATLLYTEKKEAEKKTEIFSMLPSLTSTSNVSASKESAESQEKVGPFSPFFGNSTVTSNNSTPLEFSKTNSSFGIPVPSMKKGQDEKNQDCQILATTPSFSVGQSTTTVTFQFAANSSKISSVTSPSFQFGQSTTPNSDEIFQFGVNSSKNPSGTSSTSSSIQFGQSTAPKSDETFQFGLNSSKAPLGTSSTSSSTQFGQSTAPKSDETFQFGLNSSKTPSGTPFQFGQSTTQKSNTTFHFGADSSKTSSAAMPGPFHFSPSATSGTSMNTVPFQVAASSAKTTCSPSSVFSVSGSKSGSLANATVSGSQGGPSSNSGFGFAGQPPTFGTTVSFEKPTGFNFNFGSTKSSGAESNSGFQFGNQQQSSFTNENQQSLNGGPTPAPQGIFGFTAAPHQNVGDVNIPQPSLPTATSFNNVQSNSSTAGSSFFNIGASTDSGRRVVKKAVRKLKR